MAGRLPTSTLGWAVTPLREPAPAYLHERTQVVRWLARLVLLGALVLFLGAMTAVWLLGNRVMFGRYWLLVMLGLLLLSASIHVLGRWRVAQLRKLAELFDYRICTTCGYPVAQIPAGHRCPECGQPVPVDVAERWRAYLS